MIHHFFDEMGKDLTSMSEVTSEIMRIWTWVDLINKPSYFWVLSHKGFISLRRDLVVPRSQSIQFGFRISPGWQDEETILTQPSASVKTCLKAEL